MRKDAKDIIIDKCLTLISDMFTLGTFKERESIENQYEDIVFYLTDSTPMVRLYNADTMIIINNMWDVIKLFKMLLKDNEIKITPEIEEKLRRLEEKCETIGGFWKGW